MSLNELKTRLQYQGGNQQQRMISDKLRSLKKALLYSYQAATAILEEDREFRCLINPDKNKPAYDNKILSIPFKDICLNEPHIGKTSEGEVDVPIKAGDVFVWKETNTHWLTYLRYLEQDAYYRFDIRRCDQYVDVGTKRYWVYIRGPVETSIDWAQKSKVEWNSLNYSLVMYITADRVTNEYFYRFKTLKITDPCSDTKKTWQVVGVDPYYGDGIIQVFLDEYFENKAQDMLDELQGELDKNDIIVHTGPYIEGDKKIKQYSQAIYRIKNIDKNINGKWYLQQNGEEQLLKSTTKEVTLNINTNQLNTFVLIYRIDGQEDITLEIEVIPM